MNSFVTKFLLLIIFLAVVLPLPVFSATKGLQLSVTPTLFEMSAVPDQVWNSQVKVVNSNKHPLTVFAEVVNFAPKGEAGEGKFIPVFENFTEGKTLAEWIDITPDAVVIPPETSRNIPFTVRVPSDASPGGHFAAIMVGTRPPEDKPAMRVSTSQIVTSLFFVRVAGDVVEDGVIREFTVKDKFVSTPEADFSLRFENRGNVHIQPQGQIEITNMWGKERGVIPINSKTHFGNVLPDSIRKFEFSWTGESSVTDIGRYKAVVTLGYGMEGKKFQSSTAYFWVVPIKSISIFLVSLLFSIWFVSRMIKAYVRRMLSLSGVDVDAYESQPVSPSGRRTLVREGDVLIQKKTSVKAPIRFGLKDFASRLAAVKGLSDKAKAVVRFIFAYKLFFLGLVVSIIIIAALVYFIADVSKPAKNYEVIIDNDDQNISLSSEDIIYDSLQGDDSQRVISDLEINEATTTGTTTQLFKLELINAGDKPGAAASMRADLENRGYVVDDIGSEYGDEQKRTVIVYSVGLEDEALKLSQELDNALLSASPESDNNSTPEIVVYIGNDFEFDD